MQTTVEYERKLDAPPGFELPDLGGEPLEPRVFTSVYHDTAERSLARAGITLRRRTERGRSVWQLKLPVNGARLELEEPGGPAGLPSACARCSARTSGTAQVAPVAELRTRRHGALVTRDGASAEVTIDEVSVMDAQRVEICVRRDRGRAAGRRARDAGTDREGARARGARVGPTARRSCSASSTVQKRAKKPKKPFDALRALLREQLDADARARPGNPARRGSGEPPRHAGRRPPLACSAADGQAARRDRHRGARARAEVARQSCSAPSATWTCCSSGFEAEAAALDRADRAASGRLLRTLDRQRVRARRALLKALDAPALREPARPVRVDACGARADERHGLARQARGAAAAGASAQAVEAAGAAPTDEQLHDLRKQGKRARYAHELAGRSASCASAKAFQDVLGEHQDAVVAEERLRALAHEAPADQALAAGLLIARERAEGAAARAAWPKAWRAARARGK